MVGAATSLPEMPPWQVECCPLKITHSRISHILPPLPVSQSSVSMKFFVFSRKDRAYDKEVKLRAFN